MGSRRRSSLFSPRDHAEVVVRRGELIEARIGRVGVLTDSAILVVGQGLVAEVGAVAVVAEQIVPLTPPSVVAPASLLAPRVEVPEIPEVVESAVARVELGAALDMGAGVGGASGAAQALLGTDTALTMMAGAASVTIGLDLVDRDDEDLWPLLGMLDI